jgi:hypothetical protein
MIKHLNLVTANGKLFMQISLLPGQIALPHMITVCRRQAVLLSSEHKENIENDRSSLFITTICFTLFIVNYQKLSKGDFSLSEDKGGFILGEYKYTYI